MDATPADLHPMPPGTRPGELEDRYAPIFDGDRDLAAQWVACKVHGDRSAASDLVVTYAPLVRYVVSRMTIALPPSLERSDLVGFGTIGLIDAISRFDLERGLTFQTYAVTRIRGAILDELRRLDWVPRTLRSRMHAVERETALFEQEHGREPAPDELARSTGLSPGEVRATLGAYRNGYVTSLDESWDADGGADEEPRGRQLCDETAELPEEIYDHEESQRRIRQQIRGLDPRMRAVVALYYFEELTFAEVGRVLSVSESRVCQIHGRAIRSLRAAG